jgi:hypothetical protein
MTQLPLLNLVYHAMARKMMRPASIYCATESKFAGTIQVIYAAKIR